MKRKRPVAVMDTWPVRADGLLPVEEKKKAFRSYGALSITNCQALSSGEVAEDYYFIFYFFPTCLSNEAEIGLHQDPLNFQSGFLKCNHRHTGDLDVSCCTEGQERKKKKNKSVATLQLLRCAWIKSSKREKKKKKKWNGKIQLPFENTSQSCNIKRQCVSAAFTVFDSGRGGVKTGLIKPVTAERAVAHSLVKEKGEETLLPPWVRVVLKWNLVGSASRREKKKKTETEREDLHTWVHNSIKSTSDRL